MQFAKSQQVWRLAELQAARERELAAAEAAAAAAELAAEAAEFALPNNPRQFLKPGRIFVNWDLASLIDSKYPGTQFSLDGTIVIPFGSVYYLVQTQKINDTDIPARYRVVSISRSKINSHKPTPTPAMRVSRPEPSLDCDALRQYAKVIGHSFFERAEIVSNAKKTGLCR